MDLKTKRAEYVKQRIEKVINKPTEIKRLSSELFLSERTIRRDLKT
jgi:DeoR/GlpR family transcriptional regulator of sugar metabolism